MKGFMILVGISVLAASLIAELKVVWAQESITEASYPSFSYELIPGVDAVSAIIEANGGIASADLVVEQVAVGNLIRESNVARAAAILDSGHNNTGITQINVESGNAINQANLVAVAAAEYGAVLQRMEILGRRELRANTVVSSGPREARIDASFNNTMGIVQANVAVGNLDQQINAVALTMGAGPATIILSDAYLADVGAAEGNVLIEDPDSTRLVVLNNSFEGFYGIAQVNQSAGDFVRASNLLSSNITVMNLP